MVASVSSIFSLLVSVSNGWSDAISQELDGYVQDSKQGQVGGSTPSKLESDDESKPPEFLQLRPDLTPKMEEIFLILLESKYPYSEPFVDAVRALNNFGSEAETFLVSKLNHFDPTVRRAAVLGLTWMGYSEGFLFYPHRFEGRDSAATVRALMVALRDDDYMVRHQAAEAISRRPFHAGPAIMGLLECLSDDGTDLGVVLAAWGQCQ